MEAIITDTENSRRKISRNKAIKYLRELMYYLGENPYREGLIETPDRILRMWEEIFRGYDINQKPKITTFDNEDNITDMVFDSGDYYSMCEHHVLPFFGRYYFAYIPSPSGRILGISKVARVIGYCAAKMQLQERLAKESVEMLSDAIGGEHQGMALVMKGTHLCKTMRGVKNKGEMSVAYLSGAFKLPEVKQEFYHLISLQG